MAGTFPITDTVGCFSSVSPIVLSSFNCVYIIYQKA
nr:MAG TPA: hypothetical protein [Caudoviricetes sp.]